MRAIFSLLKSVYEDFKVKAILKHLFQTHYLSLEFYLVDSLLVENQLNQR